MRISTRTIRLPPSAVLGLSYLLLIALGSVLLKLPFAAHQPTSWSEAIFTAASAATVTGLVVVDTGSHYTLAGQMVILALIQLGGVGIITFAVMILAMLGLPVGMKQRIYMREELNQTSMSDLLRMALLVLRVALILELLGTALLALEFVPRFGLAEGLWQSLFHAVSAFNNAGFALFPDSLSGWVGNPLVNLVVVLLFVAGGLGFPVLNALYYKRSWRRLDLHSKLVLAGTFWISLWAIVTFGLIEWTNPATLGGLDGTGDRMLAAVFQAMTPRTAGFNTIDIAAIEQASVLMFILLMIIGAGSASTAGGIKIGTFVVMLLATVAFFRRRADPVAFGRSIGQDQLMKLVALVALSLMAIMLATFLLALTQPLPLIELLFEVASAFGTVGLTLGATGQLDNFGRGVIVVMMFIGRVGPLALGLFLATRIGPRIRYPRGDVFLG
jgi:trk system potassium uptake protein TrkH